MHEYAHEHVRLRPTAAQWLAVPAHALAVACNTAALSTLAVRSVPVALLLLPCLLALCSSNCCMPSRHCICILQLVIAQANLHKMYIEECGPSIQASNDACYSELILPVLGA